MSTDEVLNVKDFGAQGDGNTDDTISIQNAVTAAAGGAEVFFPEGTYVITSQINLPESVSIRGVGEASVLDFSAGPITAYPDACMFATGTLTALPTIASNITQHDTTMTLVTASSLLAEDDVVILENTTDFSYNLARSYYHAGEYFRLIDVSGTTLTFDAPSFDGYTSGANISLWKLNPARIRVSSLRVIGPGATSPVVRILRVSLGRDVRVHDISGTGANHAILYIDRCYDTHISGVRAYDSTPALALNYGIAFINSQRGIVSNCQITTRRHAVTFGGSSDDGAVPTRSMLMQQSEMGSLEIFGVGLHGNNEFIEVADCEIFGGVVLAGDNTKMSDCTIWAEPGSGRGVVFSELNGPNHTLTGNEIVAVVNVTSSPAALMFWDDGDADVSSMTRTGSFRLFENKFRLGSFEGSAAQFQNRTSQNNLDVEAVGNEFVQDLTPAQTSSSTFQIRGNVAGDFVWRRIFLHGNRSVGVSLSVFNSGSREVMVQGNSVFAGAIAGIRVVVSGIVNPWDSEDVVVQDNFVDYAEDEGISVTGTQGTTNVKIRGNSSFRSGQGGSAPTNERSSITVDGAANVEMSDNMIGDDQSVVTQLRLWSVSNVDLLVEHNNVNIGTVTAVNQISITKQVQSVWSPTNQSVSHGTAPPVAGSWLVGDIRWNTGTTAGGVPGWVCTTAGTPGTWKAMAAVAT